LNSIGFWDANTSQDWGLDAHRNEGVEIVFFETGTCDLLLGNQRYHAQAGDFILTRPWQLHKFGNPNIGRGRLHWLILDVGVRRPHQAWCLPKWFILSKEDSALLIRQWQQLRVPVCASTPAIAQCFRELARCVVDWGAPLAASRLAAHINLLVIHILDVLRQQKGNDSRQSPMHKALVKAFIEGLKDGRIDLSEAWTLERMASGCNLGITTFSKYCHELVNIGPMEFLNQCRLERAAQQLCARTKRSVTEIAFATGFNSSQYFATRFRRHFKVSPSNFVAQFDGNASKKK
jgi:AraC family L-rhamnose operon regulatory protein RhaS